MIIRQTHLCPMQLHYGLHPAMFSDNDSLFIPGGMEGWVDLSTISVNNLLKIITRQRSWLNNYFMF